jgi:hypothetical protein
MAHLAQQIEDLRILMLEPPWVDFVRLTRMVDSMADSPELEVLNNDEIRAFQGFRITLHRSAQMEPDMMVKHVLAHWRGSNGVVEQAIRKLSIGPEAVACIGRFRHGPYTDQVSYGTLT